VRLLRSPLSRIRALPPSWVVGVQPSPVPAFVPWREQKRFHVRQAPQSFALDPETAYRIRNRWKWWRTSSDKLRARSHEVSAEARAKLDEQIKVMRANRDAAHKKLQEMRAASESAWQHMQTGMDTAWASMKNALDKASSQFKK
jgi:hypothetical protein